MQSRPPSLRRRKGQCSRTCGSLHRHVVNRRFYYVAPATGLEPVTFWLTARRSTIELRRNNGYEKKGRILAMVAEMSTHGFRFICNGTDSERVDMDVQDKQDNLEKIPPTPLSCKSCISMFESLFSLLKLSPSLPHS